MRWRRLWRSLVGVSRETLFRSIALELPGWVEGSPPEGLRGWRDAEDDVITVASFDVARTLRDVTDEAEVRAWSRELAEAHGAGLIEANVEIGMLGATASLIYKRRLGSGYSYTAMLLAPFHEFPQAWMAICTERGTTGVREAVVAVELANTSSLTIEEFERSWARDPYDPDYRGVDRSALCFLSDDACFDARFPRHPLSKIRRILAELPEAVRLELDEDDRRSGEVET